MRAKLSASEYENKETREGKNHTKRLNWSDFKEAPNRNLCREKSIPPFQVRFGTVKRKLVRLNIIEKNEGI